MASLPGRIADAMRPPGMTPDFIKRNRALYLAWRSVAQVGLALDQPGLLIRHRQCVQVLRRRGRIVPPFAQGWAAIDDIDGRLAVLVFVCEIAPQRIIWIQTADRLEGERLQT